MILAVIAASTSKALELLYQEAHDLICDRDADCETIAWTLSVDYDVLREDMGEVSEYYKCAATSRLLDREAR